MDCLTPKELLAAWDGLLDEARRTEQAAHLAQCVRCAELEKTLRSIVRLGIAAAPTDPLAASSSCPAEDRLLDYVAQRMSGAEKNRLEAHLAGCRQCLWQVVALAREEPGALPAVPAEWREAMLQAESLVDEPTQALAVGWRRVPAWRYALASVAAATLLALGLYWYAGKETPLPPAPSQAQVPPGEPSPPPKEPTQLAQQKPPRQSEIQVREGSGSAQTSLQVLWPQEGKQVAREELEIRWQAVPGAHLYEVAILNRRGDVVWEGQAQGDRLRVPDEIKLHTGERYFVWVSAPIQGNGTVRSPSVAFEIRASDLR